MKAKKRSIIVTCALWSVMITLNGFITLIIGEAWIRCFVPVQNVCYSHDPILGDVRCPNQKTYGYVEKGYSNILITNSQGFHDEEWQQSKSPGIFRILYFGDSLTSGVGVPIQDTIPAVVQKEINKRSPIPVEVYNMAPAEDSTAAQLLTFQKIGINFEPDMVVCHFMGDFSDNIFETHQRTRSPYFRLTSQDTLELVPPIPVDLTTPVEKLKRNSMLVRLLANKLLASKFLKDLLDTRESLVAILSGPMKNTTRKSKNQKSSMPQNETTMQLLTEKSWPVTIKMLEVFKEEAERIGASFILIDGNRLLPKTAGKYRNNDLENFCLKENIDYIPIYEEYHDLKENDSLAVYFLKDGHPTSMGNEYLAQIVAQKIAPVLSDQLNIEE